MEAGGCCVTQAYTVCRLFWKHHKLEIAKKAVLILSCQIILLLPLLACESCQIIPAVNGQYCSGNRSILLAWSIWWYKSLCKDWPIKKI